jgi:hypothetical protein
MTNFDLEKKSSTRERMTPTIRQRTPKETELKANEESAKSIKQTNMVSYSCRKDKERRSTQKRRKEKQRKEE